jgi:hypothetical protein
MMVNTVPCDANAAVVQAVTAELRHQAASWRTAAERHVTEPPRTNSLVAGWAYVADDLDKQATYIERCAAAYWYGAASAGAR